MPVSNSIVIVSFNSKAAVLALLKSLHIEEATSSEVILVDSASFDGTLETVREQFPRVKLLPLQNNRGYFAAANKGIEQAEGDIVTLCHADVITDVHTLAELADQAREAEGRKVAAVIPRLVGVDGSAQGNVGKLPGLGSSLVGIFNPPAGLKCDLPALDHIPAHEWGRFVCVALNQNALATVGLFDEKFFLYAGDTDLCARLHAKQYRILVSKTVSIPHAGAAIGKEIPSHLMRILRNDQKRYAEKYLPAWQKNLLNVGSTIQGWFSKPG